MERRDARSVTAELTVKKQLTAAVETGAQAHVELHRRSSGRYVLPPHAVHLVDKGAHIDAGTNDPCAGGQCWRSSATACRRNVVRDASRSGT
jgi:hypothetical protein